MHRVPPQVAGLEAVTDAPVTCDAAGKDIDKRPDIQGSGLRNPEQARPLCDKRGISPFGGQQCQGQQR